MSRRSQVQIAAADFHRPVGGPVFEPQEEREDLPLSRGAGWQSNGGPHRGHLARSFPFTLDVTIPAGGPLLRIHLVGTFALFAEREEEAPGTLGASLQLTQDRELVFRQDLLNGRHYSDARDLTAVSRLNGDGTSVETLGSIEAFGAPARVDVLTIDVGEQTASALRLKDLGSPASFIVFDVLLEREQASGCPFHSGSGGIALGEIPSVVRVGDRVKFLRALDQLAQSVVDAEDLDEARGTALTFLAVTTAATLEMGGSRQMHRIQLDAAREFERLDTREEIADAARRYVETVAESMFRGVQSPSSYLVDRALAIVERNYAKDLSDSQIANQLGLSTSHFRYLFREATGQPFHKYLVALRLEKARQMLLEDEIAVSAVARAVGFTGLSHFSRAFTQRFSVSPTSIRRQGGS